MKYYSINTNTMYIKTEFLSDHKKSIAKEITGDEYLIKQSSNKVIEENCLRFSSNYLHRKEMTKDMINAHAKPPIMIDFFGSFIYFPLYSDRNSYNTWFNIRFIKFYEKEGDGTKITFSNNEIMTVDVSNYQFDKQYSSAMKLYFRISMKREEFYTGTGHNEIDIMNRREMILMDEYRRNQYLDHMKRLNYKMH